MTESASPATAVVTKTKPQDHLPPEVRAQIELRRAMNAVAAEIAGLSWGRELEQGARRAIAAWGRTYNVDVSTEIHILGGRLYLNAAYYIRRLSGLIENGVIDHAYADHINVDPRLLNMGDEGMKEAHRRAAERVRYNVPDEAKAAVAFRVKVKSMEQEVVGVKWCGGGTKKNDPVGEQFPTETAESRAARRCLKLRVADYCS